MFCFWSLLPNCFQMVKLFNGVVIHWNGIKTVEIVAPSSLRGQMCGICGANDGQPGHNRALGPKALAGQCPGLKTNNAVSRCIIH